MNARLQVFLAHKVSDNEGQMIRTSDAPKLAAELVRVREITLAVFDAYEAANALDVPQREEFNPPLWELGHVGWFQQWWIGRNRQRPEGTACDPAHERAPCPHLVQASGGDAWYNSSTVPHAQRWTLPLPHAKATQAYLQATLDQTLQCLAQAGSSDADLYFYRLVLLHEAMHIEAAVYMAQALERPVTMPAHLLNAMNSEAISAYSIRANPRFGIKNRLWTLGSDPTGFAFDNEWRGEKVALADFEIDAQPLAWEPYLAFVQSTGYPLPRYLRDTAQGFEVLRFGQWLPLDLNSSAVHLSWHDAQAYCLWADRRLPTEAEWECAALTQPGFTWGQVWEWTASNFLPYEGFTAHPYRDYSEPWFGSRKVLRGACAATLPIMRNAKYRNFFLPDRTDIYAGFRTCAK